MKMKSKLTMLAYAIGLCALAAGPAAAGLVAGWDFSNLSGDGASVPALYPANRVGNGSAGAISVSGDVIASAMEPGSNTTDDGGIQGGIHGNRNATDPTFPMGTTSFTGGQLLGLTARDVATIEFDATLPVATANPWQLTFGGRAIAGLVGTGSTTIGVSFGQTCGATTPVGDVTLGATDTEVQLILGQSGTARGCVVFDVDGTTDQPLIDNVSISVPEPGMGGLLLAGVAGLVGLGRARQR